MYLVLLMCVLDQTQGFSRYQKPTTPFQAPKPEKPPYCDWPPESSRIISQMSEVKFGYNSMQLIKTKPDMRTAIANPGDKSIKQIENSWSFGGARRKNKIGGHLRCTNSTRARVLEG